MKLTYVKKLTVILLAFCLLVAAFPLLASAAEYSGSCGNNLTWAIDGNVLTISGIGPMNDYDSSQDQPWYKYKNTVTKVVVNSGVTSIGSSALSGLDVTTVTLPDTLTSIGVSAFYACEKLTGITIPSGITQIQNNTFCDCANLSYVTIPGTVTSIGEFAFDDCESLTSIELPDGLKSIGTGAFRNTGLTSIKIPGGVNLDTVLFRSSALVSVELGYGISSIPDGLFMYCNNLESVTIPSTVESIGEEAFYFCRSLKSVDLPSSVKTIGDSTFYYCDTLTNISLGAGLETIGSRAFRFCDSLREITVPSSCTSIGGEAFYTYYPMTITMLNPNCQISTRDNTMGTTGVVTIRGYKGSTAEAHALKYGYAFEALESEPEIPVSFTDVKSGDYFYQPVVWAVENDITSGTSTTTFSPSQACTRAQAMTFLWKAAGKPEPTSVSNPFRDVMPDAYYYKAVLWAVENGITSGTSTTTFSPEQSCTRGQIMTFLYKAAGSPSVSGSNPFRDVKNSDYFYNPVLWAVKNNITSGTSATTFSPNQSCTRAQIVTFLYKHYA